MFQCRPSFECHRLPTMHHLEYRVHGVEQLREVAQSNYHPLRQSGNQPVKQVARIFLNMSFSILKQITLIAYSIGLDINRLPK